MDGLTIETARLHLRIESLKDARAGIAAMPEEMRAEISADYLRLLDSASEGDYWVLGFVISDRENISPIGQCGFKGPPSADGVVEIAYAIEPAEQGKGYATESADALTKFALEHFEVRLVRAHTLPEDNASTRVLTKCGFERVGEAIDPDDGLVWRWEVRETKND